MHPAQAHAPELEPDRLRNALTEGGLAHARGADEAENGTAALGIEFSNGQEFQYPALNFLEPIVILVKGLPRLLDVDRLGIDFRPGHGEQPVEVGSGHGVFGGRVRHALQTLDLTLGLLGDLRRHAGVLDGLLHLVDLGRRGIGFAQLFLNLPQPLAQHGFLLPFVERFAGPLIDLARHFQNFDAPAEQGQYAIQPVLEIERGQDLLLFGGLQIHEARHHVGQRRNRFDAANGVDEFPRRLGQQLHGLQRLFAQV